MLDHNHSPGSPQGSPAAEFENKHCVFQLGDSQFALIATAVREITYAPPLVRVPQCPPSLAGICHVRSEFVPAVLLGPLLGNEAPTSQEPEQLLVLSSPRGSWALMIDRVIAIDSIQTHVDAGNRSDSQLSAVLGTATYRSVVTRVLDPGVLHRMIQQSRPPQWNPAGDLEHAGTTPYQQRIMA